MHLVAWRWLQRTGEVSQVERWGTKKEESCYNVRKGDGNSIWIQRVVLLDDGQDEGKRGVGHLKGRSNCSF